MKGWEKGRLGRGTTKYKGSEAGPKLMCSRNREAASVAIKFN